MDCSTGNTGGQSVFFYKKSRKSGRYLNLMPEMYDKLGELLSERLDKGKIESKCDKGITAPFLITIIPSAL